MESPWSFLLDGGRRLNIASSMHKPATQATDFSATNNSSRHHRSPGATVAPALYALSGNDPSVQYFVTKNAYILLARTHLTVT